MKILRFDFKLLNLIISRPAYNDYIAKDNVMAARKLLSLFEEKFNSIDFSNIVYKPKFSSKDVGICIVAIHYQVVYTNDNKYIYPKNFNRISRYF